MQRLKSILTKIFCVPYFLFKACLSSLKKGNAGKVLIVQFGHFGDALVDSGAILAIKEQYEREGKKVYLLCAPPVWEMLKRIPGFDGMVILPYASYNLYFSFDVFRNILCSDVIGTGYSDVILLSPVVTPAFLMASCIPGKKYGLLYPEFFLGWRKIIFFLFRPFYKKVLISKPGQKRFQLVAQFLNEIGIKGYKPRITFLPGQLVDIKPEEPYISLVIDSSNPARIWPREYFIELISLLLKNYIFKIYLLGTKKDEQITKMLKTLPREQQERVKDLSGQTSVDEWIERIRGSEFIIGVDSGAIHVAASTGTMAFCLAGRWLIDLFVPYPPEVVHEKVKLPICIFRDDADNLPCRNCNGRTGRYGKTNKKCYRLCEQGQGDLCLLEIKPENVLQVVMRHYEINSLRN